MKIGDLKDTTTQLLQQYQRNAHVGQAVERPVNSGAVREERVDLSNQSRDLVNIKKAIDRLPEIREERIMDLKNRIEKGTYDIQSEKIAEKMVRESLIDILA